MVKRSLQSPDDGGTTGLVVSGTALIAVTYGVVRYGFGLQLPRLSEEFGLDGQIIPAARVVEDLNDQVLRHKHLSE